MTLSDFLKNDPLSLSYVLKYFQRKYEVQSCRGQQMGGRGGKASDEIRLALTGYS